MPEFKGVAVGQARAYPVAARLLGLRVRIPPAEWMPVVLCAVR